MEVCGCRHEFIDVICPVAKVFKCGNLGCYEDNFGQLMAELGKEFLFWILFATWQMIGFQVDFPKKFGRVAFFSKPEIFYQLNQRISGVWLKTAACNFIKIL